MFNKKAKAGILAAGLVSAVCIGTLTAPRADAVSNVDALLCPDYNIVIDATTRSFYNVNAERVYPINYGGTTYLPVRAIGELMGKNVDWNQDTKTITLSGTRVTTVTPGAEGDVPAAATPISATLRDDFTVVIEGKTESFADANGQTVYPLLYNGSTYLPIRAIGKLMGKEVGWDATSKTVTLAPAQNAPLVTDADSFSNGQNPQTPDAVTGATTKPSTPTQPTQPTQPVQGTAITAEQAKQIALTHAGLSADAVTMLYAKPDYEKGRQVFEVEFYTANTEYDYDIDAQTGDILSFDYDAEHRGKAYPDAVTGATTKPNKQSKQDYLAQNQASFIGEQQAKQIAMQDAGVSGVSFAKVKLDYDDGRAEYEVEFYANGYEYEYEIDATTGTIYKRDIDRD